MFTKRFCAHSSADVSLLVYNLANKFEIGSKLDAGNPKHVYTIRRIG
jgi:hypothetical protein